MAESEVNDNISIIIIILHTHICKAPYGRIAPCVAVAYVPTNR